MAGFNAARTNLSSTQCEIHSYEAVGSGAFRDVVEGTYIGGNRNQQAAVCKAFKHKFHHLEEEYYEMDFKVTDKAIQYANEWNLICPEGKEILINRGSVQHSRDGRKYLIEPFIRDFVKFTSNSGTIVKHHGRGGSANTWAMEAFSHFTYHRSGGSLLICDLQGRYKRAKFADHPRKSRFELTDLACCSRGRTYGPTDLGEKGIESFFTNHVCNALCNQKGRWARPRNPVQWFAESSVTSMLSSRESHKLNLTNPTKFRSMLGELVEEDEYDSDYD